MSLVSLSGVAVEFGATPIVSDVDLTVSRGDRWGIVGRNGSGKTTLLSVVAGTLEPTRGAVARASGLRVTVLGQHRDFGAARTVWEAAAGPFAELLALERSLQEQARALESASTPEALDRYGRDLERFERGGGYTFAPRVDAVLHGLGFDPDDARTRELAGLSGGERGRVALARQLVAPADVLLLDEPTNHLDLETTRWLEEYLVGLDATILLISHDRAFLERVVDHVLHVEAGTATPYRGGYADFVRQHAERRRAQERAFEQQQRKIAAEEDYIRRNIAGQNSRQAKGRRTRLERMPRLSAPPGEEEVMSLRLEPRQRGGDQVLVTEDLRLEIGGRVLLQDFTTRVERGEVIGLVGPNGAGKSTLLRAVVGEREPAGGTLRLGASIEWAYYRQDLGQVPPEKTIFDIVHDLRPLWNRGQVMGHLGRFGFSGEETSRRAGTLSGGEQARVALAMVMLSRANLLLFDEPTNHLDVESIEALEDALSAYDGTVVLVSHDRALLRALVERTWILHEGRITDFPGSFAEWEVAAREREHAAAVAAAEEEAARRVREQQKTRRTDDALKEQRAALRSARRELESVEARVARAEARVAELVATLEDPGLYASPEGSRRAAALGAELDAARAELDRAFADWAEATERLEALEEA